MTDFKLNINKKDMPGFLRYIISFVIGIFLLSVFALAGSFIVYLSDDPYSLLNITGYTVLYVSVLISGIISARITNNGAFGALAVGLAFAFLLVILSFFFGKQLDLYIKIILLISVAASSFLGGFIGKKREKKNSLKSRYKKLR